MSTAAQAMLRTFERLSVAEQAEQAEVADFAEFLLSRQESAAAAAVEHWLAVAPGAASPNVTTDGVMALTRGEP